MKRALILTDGKAGHENQSRAFARALGLECDVLEVHFASKGAKAASYLLDWLGVFTTSLFTPAFDGTALKGRYAVVIGAGSGTFYAAKALSRKIGAKNAVVLYPRGYRLATFDCILAPAFDRPARRANVVEMPANLVASDEAFYARGVETFRERHAIPDGATAVSAVIVGGPNKCSTMTAEWMRGQLERIFAESRREGRKAEVWVTTSRRTPPEVERVVDAFPFDYKLLYSQNRYNPIPAFVKLAGRLYVTAESTGMLSEACTFGKAEVVALDNLLPGQHKFRRFVEGLRRAGYVDGARKIDLSEPFAAARRLLGLA